MCDFFSNHPSPAKAGHKVNPSSAIQKVEPLNRIPAFAGMTQEVSRKESLRIGRR